MPKTVAIVQSNYIPWKGYFDMINSVDEFVLYDDSQYTRRDWRNRNRIKTPQGVQWLTVPVEVKGKYFQRICDTVVSDPEWASTHWKTLVHSYSRAKHFAALRDRVEELYLGCDERYLSRINHRFLAAVCDLLEIRTPISWSMDFELVSGKNERLLDLCKKLGATEYLSGPAARDYLDEGLFAAEGIAVRWMDYTGYPAYNQLFPPFEHGVSVLDLLFNEGTDAPRYMKSF